MKSQFKTLLLVAALSTGAFVGAAGAADEPASAEKSAPAAAGQAADGAPEAAPAAPADGASMKPIDRVKATPKGQLKNPFDYKDPKIAEEGHKIYMGLPLRGVWERHCSRKLMRPPAG